MKKISFILIISIVFLLNIWANTALASGSIVGSWWIGTNSDAVGEIVSLTFYANGTYIHAQNGDDVDPSWIGLEYGSYTHDPITNVLTTQVIYDQNGEVGFSHLSGTGSVTITVNGNTAIFNSAGDGNFTIYRVGTSVAPSVPGMTGDVNGDAKIDITDAIFVLQTLTGIPTTTPLECNSLIGAWSYTDGANFSYAVFFDNNSFLYAEYDQYSTKWWTENGLEAGTYSCDPESGNITFTISYDDNDPGDDSGVGDIGTPAVINASLSNGNNTLTFAGGELTLHSVDFTGTSPIVGTWSLTQGAAFEYLILFADNTFLLAENDLTVQTAAENGLEVGTYSYDSTSGNITFNIIYDDNAPGTDSGIGDIGTPVVVDTVLSNNNNTLTVAGGTIAFARSF